MSEPQLYSRRGLLAAATSFAVLSSTIFARDKTDTPITGDPVRGLEPFDELMRNFLKAHGAPGAALAVSRQGKLIYARGFGYADTEAREPVAPDALFRIASVTKPITAAAVLKLAELGKFELDDKVLNIVKLQPHLNSGAAMDPRWNQITIRHLLQHTGGWDRDKSFDPVARPEEVARTLAIEPPPMPEAIIRYMMGKPLDFDPGDRYAYSNLGYLLLGRVVAATAKQDYEQYVRKSVLRPLGIVRPRLGKALLEDRQKGEVKYYCTAELKGPALFGPKAGQAVPVQYGHDNVQGFESHGGWIASAPDLVRFAADFDDRNQSTLLHKDSVDTMWARPKGQAGYNPSGNPTPTYYGCGWSVRPLKGGTSNQWHTGYIAGTSTLLVRRWDGLNWAVLFNMDHSSAENKLLADLIDPLVHQAADQVKHWPAQDMFAHYLRPK
jgi:N-acyl-D-amino-acid deacylase